MNIKLLLFIFFALQARVYAQTGFKFSFGTGETVKGYMPVTTKSIFSSKTGYGFEQGAFLEAVQRNERHQLTSAFITSPKPFYFSVQLPEGNYDVKLLPGDINGYSATTVRTECRRLMLNNIRTAQGTTTTVDITIHIRDSLIRDSGGHIVGKVKLKQREYGFLHWDNLLTLEFNDSLPKISAIEIKPNTTATTIFLAGNSTVVDQDREPWAAWGQMLPYFLQPV